MQLKYGSKEEQKKIRDNLKKLEAITRNLDTIKSKETNNITESGTEKPKDMTTHWCMMQMQQQTFNTYSGAWDLIIFQLQGRCGKRRKNH